ncbi:MAG: hypothetical protein H6Q73_1128 [Firmicutes bacterium]|nr:hypothetical protein [Bacillota bacterium]
MSFGKNVITIKASANSDSEIVMHPKQADEIKLGRKKRGFISFGSQKQYINILMNNEISPDNVLISPKLMAELHLPDYPIYEMSVDKNEIIIGPYIGLLVSENDEKLTVSRMKRTLAYVREYSKLHGAIIVFALNKVDKTNRLIEGYCYNPIKNYWQKGIFPYPASIYRSIGLSDQWKNHFLSVSGDKIFNNHYFGKWEMYQWFSQDSELNHHIPYTVLYESPQDVFNLLERYKKIYIKPVSGLRGHGIVKVTMENKIFVFQYREQGVNGQAVFESISEANEYIQKRFNNRKYLIQQAIDLIEYQGGIIDFRCVVQKNQANIWICNAIVGRLGNKGSIVSNISSGGAGFLAADILGKVISSDEEDILALIERIESFAIAVCNALDKCGINCGTLGVDVGLDTKGYLWLIEINNRDPDPKIALDIHDEQLYHILKTSPLFYAKSLAGFTRAGPDLLNMVDCDR